MGRTYYDCPCCERRVWVHAFWGAGFVGAICHECRDDHGNYTTSSCNVNGPAKRRREAAERDARRRAEQRRYEEEERVRKRARELERKERERQKAREDERRRQRILEQKALENQRKAAAAERERNRKKMEDALKKKTEELEKEAEKLQKLKLQTQDPFLQYKKMHTLRTMKDIGKQVSQVAVVGEIVKERVSEISKDLEDTLKDDYKLIEKEMDRYKQYGTEMKNMTNVFKTELRKAFKALAPDIATDSATLQNDSNKYDTLIDNESDEDDKKYYQNKKNSKQNQIKSKLKVVEDAMNAIQCKLNIMKSYYKQMVEDYNYFETFINTKDDELFEAVNYFQDIAGQLKKSPDRSKLFVSKTSELYDDYKSKPQILTFTEKYEYKSPQTTGVNMGDAIVTGTAVGAVGGGIIGGVVGLCVGGPVGGAIGLVGGAIGGAVLGAGIGAIVGACNPQKVSYTTKTGYVEVDSKLIAYKNEEHAQALQKIVENIQNTETYKKMQNEMVKSKELAKQRRNELRRLNTQMMKVQQPLLTYKCEMNKLRNILEKGDNVTDDDAKMIDKKLQKLSAEMQVIIKTMT